MENVLLVSSFVDEPIRSELDRLFLIRNLALKKCCSIPGYKTLGHRGKNNIYDHVKQGIITQMEEQK